MKVTVLGSGSSGNSILVESERVRLLIDAGFSGRDLERRLASVEVEASSLDGLLVTHDHSDHTRGMGVLARRWGVPIHITCETLSACDKLLKGDETIRPYACGEPAMVGDLLIHPFLTVHDAVDPVAVTVSELGTGEKLGIATDLGRPTASVRHALQECDLLVLEANHDEILLRESPYPWSVKQRIMGSHGHLSNRAAAELAAELHHPGLAAVVLAHLSENSNDPDLAYDVVGAALERKRFAGEILVGRQHEALETIDVTRLRRLRLPPQMSLF